MKVISGFLRLESFSNGCTLFPNVDLCSKLVQNQSVLSGPEVVSVNTHLVLCSGGPLPGHADVPGSNPGRTLYSIHALSD